MIIGCNFCQYSYDFNIVIPNEPSLVAIVKNTFKSYKVTVHDISNREKEGWLQIVAGV